MNWYKNLNRNAQIAIAVAVCVFTPIVGIVFNLAFGIVGLIFNLINWKGFLFLIVVGIAFATKAFFSSDDDEEMLGGPDMDDTPFPW